MIFTLYVRQKVRTCVSRTVRPRPNVQFYPPSTPIHSPSHLFRLTNHVPQRRPYGALCAPYMIHVSCTRFVNNRRTRHSTLVSGHHFSSSTDHGPCLTLLRHSRPHAHETTLHFPPRSQQTRPTEHSTRGTSP